MDFESIKNITVGFSLYPFNNIIRENQIFEQRLNSIRRYNNVPVEDIKEFASSRDISFKDTMLYAARYGALPDEQTVLRIYHLGFDRWQLWHEQGFM